MRRFGICLTLCLIAGLGSAGGRAAHAAPAQALGKAYAAFDDGDFGRARAMLGKRVEKSLLNGDYLLYLRGQSEYFEGDFKAALASFEELSKRGDSRFVSMAKWRACDALWQLGQREEAARRYGRYVASKLGDGELAIARFRLAEAAEAQGRSKSADRAIALYRDFLRKHPAHTLSPVADTRLVALGHGGIAALSAADRIQRGIDLIDDKKWEIALQELAELDTGAMDEATRLQHQFWLNMSLFKRRRHYERAGRSFLAIYKKMGSRADEALFHGARALSRADFDKEAIGNYQLLVKEYPRSSWAAEAQFLSGWLEFNMGNYELAVPHLQEMARRFGKSKFAAETPWYEGMSYYHLGKFDKALPLFERVAKQGGKEVGPKGRYWTARTLQKLGKLDQAKPIYRELVGAHPFSWYALLSRARLMAEGDTIGPFGDSPLDAASAPDLDGKLDAAVRKDPLILKANELIVANLIAAAGVELRRGEKSFLRRHARKKSAAMAVLLDTYRRAGNFNRPWMLAVVHGGSRALNAEPKGKARIWWQHAYPLAYEEFVERYRNLSNFPDYFLYTIMRKESGFDPHTHSYADAQGLLQMIPPTTIRVVPHLGLEYTEDLLFDPERNIQTGAWYIGRLLKKFKGQIPIGAGSFNSGPRAVMTWLKRNGNLPVDEFVELVSYQQTRNYMKRTTETYARYKYLYDQEIYEQPLELDPAFEVNDIDY